MGKNKNKPPSHILLDQFTDRDLTSWKRYSDDDEEYEVRVFYHLESLRVLHHEALLESLRSVASVNVKEEGWCRIVDAIYNNTPLSAAGSISKAGRFNIGHDLPAHAGFAPFPCLYIAEDRKTAYAEKFTLEQKDGEFSASEFALRDYESYSVFKINAEINNLFDLSRAVNLKRFAEIISSFELPLDLIRLRKKIGRKGKRLITLPRELKDSLLDVHWRHNPVQYELPANSQIFGRLVKEAGFEGILYPSTKLQGKKCVALFLENLEKSDSLVQLAGTVSNDIKYKNLSSENWKKLF